MLKAPKGLTREDSALWRRAMGIADLLKERSKSNATVRRHTEFVMLALATELQHGMAAKCWRTTKRLGR